MAIGNVMQLKKCKDRVEICSVLHDDFQLTSKCYDISRKW